MISHRFWSRPMFFYSLKDAVNFAVLQGKFTSNKRLLLPILLALAIAYPPLRSVTITTLADAFFQVTVFVASTLYLYRHLVDKLPHLQLNALYTRSPILEVAFAAFLGALPGCGGAIVVVTQFTQRQASFGALVAVLTATMGDAAFLLLAQKPLEGLLILLLGISVGFLSGIAVNRFCNPLPASAITKPKMQISAKPISYVDQISIIYWQIIMLPCLIIALLMAFNIDFGLFTHAIELFGCTMAVLIAVAWSLSPITSTYNMESSSTKKPNMKEKQAARYLQIIEDTHFVSAWVIVSFMLYEILVNVGGLDVASWFSEFAMFTPLMAVLVGLLPGCGPQIVVTTLYIQGVIPFSALAGNAISNDGDALFPAIALAPKAALLATLYSTVPALIVAYTLYGWS